MVWDPKEYSVILVRFEAYMINTATIYMYRSLAKKGPLTNQAIKVGAALERVKYQKIGHNSVQVTFEASL